MHILCVEINVRVISLTFQEASEVFEDLTWMCFVVLESVISMEATGLLGRHVEFLEETFYGVLLINRAS